VTVLHTHPYEEVFVTLEGEATFTVGDDTIEVSAGQIVVAPAGVPRHRDNHICKPAPTLI
jgi:quercetin dioxygenase-like cupin family protein